MSQRLRRPSSPSRRALVLAAWLLALFPLGAGPATGHTDLAGSDPAAGARLQRAPERIVLRFTDAISGDFAQLSLTRGAARTSQRLQAEVDGATVSADVPAPGPSSQGENRWVVAYRVVSADGHPITGSVRFTAPVETSERSASPRQTEPRTEESPGVARDESSATDAGTDAGDASVPWALLALGAVAGAVVLAVAARGLWARRSR